MCGYTVRHIINRAQKLHQKAGGIRADRTKRHFGSTMKEVRKEPPVIVVWSEFDEVQSTYEFGTQVRQYSQKFCRSANAQLPSVSRQCNNFSAMPISLPVTC